MQEYEELLKRAYERLPKLREGGERFEIPTTEIIIEGNQTTIKNFSQICEKLRRNQRHLLRFLTKELAAPGSSDGQRAIFQSKLSKKSIDSKLEGYVKEYVLCKECRRPDTQLIKENRITFLKCEACGAKGSVKEIR